MSRLTLGTHPQFYRGPDSSFSVGPRFLQRNLIVDKNAVFMFRAACVLCGVAVAFGAFGAHGLKGQLTPKMLDIFEVGVRYQFYHGLALLVLSLGGTSIWQSNWANRAGLAWIVGVTIFSGSLYVLAVSGISWLGAITPIGGVALLLGWSFAFVSAAKIAATCKAA